MFHRLSRRVVRDDFAEYMRLANPPGDQVGVLRAKIDDRNGLKCRLRLTRRFGARGAIL